MGAFAGGVVTGSGCISANNRTRTTDSPNRQGGSDVPESEWPSFQVDARNTGYHPRSSGPTDEVTTRWELGAEETKYSEIAVSGGTVFAGDRSNLYAIDTDTRSKRWEFQSNNPVNGCPAAYGDRIYIRAGNDHVFSISGDDGEQLWHFEMQATGYSPDWSAPTVADDTVYVGGTGGHLYALARKTGKERWRSSLGEKGTVVSTPAVDGDTVYITSRRNHVFALDAADGTERWHVRPAMANRNVRTQLAPTVANSTVYVGVRAARTGADYTDEGRIYALATEDGSVRWNRDTKYPVRRSPSTDGNLLYVGTSAPENGELLALDATDGTERWRVESEGGVSTAPVVAGNTLYAGVAAPAWEGGRNLYSVNAFDTNTGIEQWQFDLGELRGSRTPAVVDGTVYIGSSSVWALE